MEAVGPGELRPGTDGGGIAEMWREELAERWAEEIHRPIVTWGEQTRW